MARNLARTYLPPLASLDIPCYWFTAIRCGMLLPLMAWPSRTSWSAWKFPQRCSPHRPDPRESATSRAEPGVLACARDTFIHRQPIVTPLPQCASRHRNAAQLRGRGVRQDWGRATSCSGCTRPHCNRSIFSFRPSPAWTHDDNGGDTRRAPSRGSAAIPSGIVVAARHLDSPRAGWSTLGVRAHDWRRAPWRCT